MGDIGRGETAKMVCPRYSVVALLRQKLYQCLASSFGGPADAGRAVPLSSVEPNLVVTFPRYGT